MSLDSARRRGPLPARRERRREVDADRDPLGPRPPGRGHDPHRRAHGRHLLAARRRSICGIGTVYQHSDADPGAHGAREPDARRRPPRSGSTSPAAGARLAELAAALGVEVDPDAPHGRARRSARSSRSRSSRRSGAARASSSSTSPPRCSRRRAWPSSRRSSARLKAQGHGRRLHHPQAARGAVARRQRLDPPPGTPGGRDRRARRCAATPHEELRAAIVRIMFGEEARAVADVAELQEEIVERVEPTRPAAVRSDDGARARRRSRRRQRGRARDRRTSRSRSTRARCSASPASTATASARWPRSIAGQRSDGRRRPAPVRRLDPRSSASPARQKLGLRYVTDDRLGEGIVASLSVGSEPVPQAHRPAPVLAPRPHPAGGASSARPASSCEEFDVRTPSVKTRAGTLSGGNIQKVLLARELSFEPRVVVFHKPTYGLDVRRPRASCATPIRGSGRQRRRGARHLDRPRRAARDLRPHRGALPRPPRRARSRTGPARPRRSAS